VVALGVISQRLHSLAEYIASGSTSWGPLYRSCHLRDGPSITFTRASVSLAERPMR